MDKIEERLATIEECLRNIEKSSEITLTVIKDLKNELSILRTHVNDEIFAIQKEMIGYKITQKILIFIGGILTSSLAILFFDYIKRGLGI